MKRLSYVGLIPLAFAGIAASEAGDSSGSRVGLPDRGVCAHRGASDTHPENTLAAFREAIRLGAHMIEFDVYLTKDKELVVIHDETVDHTTDGQGNVSDLSLAEIKRLDAGSWKDPRFKGERVPTLKETLAVMPENVWLNVHLKGDKELGQRAAEVIAQQGRIHQAFLACGQAASEAAREAIPEILICNMERQDASWEYLRETITMKADFIQLAGPIDPEFQEFAEELKKHRIRINYFGTDSPDELRTLFKLGIEFPLVNAVGPLMKAAEELGIEALQPTYAETKQGR